MNKERDTTRIVESWLAEPSPPFSDRVIDQTIDRLRGTRQRRRWWPFRWFPFGFGATRSTGSHGPRPHGRTKLMFSATRIAAVVAIVALGGSLALVAGPLGSGLDPGFTPAALAPAPGTAAHFSGSGGIIMVEEGEESVSEGVGHLRGQVTSMPPRLIEVDEPRVAGTQTYTQHADDYGGYGPSWGSLRIEDDEGAWVGDVTGFHAGNAGRFSGWLVGEGAYTGLVQYYAATTGYGFNVRFEGIILPADLAPLASDTALAE
jgi:hypothetical protein